MNDGPIKILLIDDDAFCTSALKHAMREHDVIVAHDGKEGIRAYEEHKPDIVFLDISLPGLNGFEVLKELRRDPSSFVVMLTEMNNELYMKKCLADGAKGFLSKSYQKEAFGYYIDKCRK